jgi:putative mycofactocin binding protein MftB
MAGSATFDLDHAWQVDPRVSLRPEPFGALLYHFGTRRLSFLKNQTVLAVVRSLADHPSARAACLAAGVTEGELPTYARALGALADSDMISERTLHDSRP